MTITTGTRPGCDEIHSQLSAGGMGEDYLVYGGAEKQIGTGRWSNIDSIVWSATHHPASGQFVLATP